MIIQTGMRTDIPAFYADWFANRLREGFVLVRNPYNPLSVTRYELNPSVVDLIGFCTKNPAPMLRRGRMELLSPYGQYWFVTITPYGREIEPNVPPKEEVIDSFLRLSQLVGADSVAWRYDPILLDKTYTPEHHIRDFGEMARALAGSTKTCVISFIDLFRKVKNNYPEATAIPPAEQHRLTAEFVRIAAAYGMTVRPCGESPELAARGADCGGCMTVRIFEQAIGRNLNVPPNPKNRKECACYLTGDIGQYNSCGHLCRYCYANADRDVVRRNMALHDPESPLLIGSIGPDDIIHHAAQESWIDPQLRLTLC
ncbi:DUF1848 domain-containing protein [Lachnoclostridium sp. Marseille-P6806]|uniref:DUF1848 domain-containing protein n=1 Tax=Lachnoclostridium sp. Marseille-P6806 TaxID=2364793 RepID=UPI0010315203|nr:DUF1848 domain-containing protein [Lachnoclostridium sp. Marseille-P6806]